MPRISPVDPSKTSSEVRSIFQEIEKGFGMIPNLFLTMAHYPPLLKANWEKVKAVMMKGKLPRKVKEAIALVVSKDNGFQYCIQAHSAALRGLKVADEAIALILKDDLASAGFDIKAMALIQFAQAANKTPHSIPDEITEAIQEAGVSDAELVETLGVMEIFVAFNRFLDALEVDIDF